MLTQLIIIQVVTFIGLILLLRMLFHRNLDSALFRLKDLQEETLKKDAQVKEELERVKQVRLSEMEKGKQEAKKLIDEAKKQADTIRSRIEEDAKAEAQKVITQGKELLAKTEEKLLAAIDAKALNIAVEIIKSTFTEKSLESLQHELLNEIIAEIEHLDKERVTVKTGRAKVISSSILTETERARLKNALSTNLGYELIIEESIDPGLITGLVVQIGEFIIDGSLKNKLQKIIPYLTLKKKQNAN